ncbi:MAG: hypothetical protein BWY63_03930 [Chloroflexi bacterium ADurb.Bin360]|nr:MAG: hypothetical protein BWY63_03930 [Chloroflexi bacterium ADurb.Bin360]
MLSLKGDHRLTRRHARRLFVTLLPFKVNVKEMNLLVTGDERAGWVKHQGRVADALTAGDYGGNAAAVNVHVVLARLAAQELAGRPIVRFSAGHHRFIIGQQVK